MKFHLKYAYMLIYALCRQLLNLCTFCHQILSLLGRDRALFVWKKGGGGGGGELTMFPLFCSSLPLPPSSYHLIMIIFEQGRRRVYNWGHNRTGGRGWEEMAKSEELSKYEKWGKKWSESLICWTKKWKKGDDLFFFILDQLFASLCSDAVHPSSSDI